MTDLNRIHSLRVGEKKVNEKTVHAKKELFLKFKREHVGCVELVDKKNFFFKCK